MVEDERGWMEDEGVGGGGWSGGRGWMEDGDV